MTPDQRTALELLVPREKRSGDDEADLLAAVREAERRRTENTRDAGAVVRALHDLGWTFRAIEEKTGVPYNTAQRWATPSS